MIAIAAVAGILLVGGLVIISWAVRNTPQPAKPKRTIRLPKQLKIDRKTRNLIIIAVLAGILAYLISQWVILLVLIPLGILILPWLLSTPENQDLEILASLDRWVHAITSSLHTGKSIKDAIRATRAQVPTNLQRPVQLFLARLDERWPTRDAFYAMANDINSPDADMVIAALALASERGGTGAVATLDALSENISERLSAAREISVERAKPRVVVRQVTIITMAFTGVGLVFGSSFLEPYKTPIGMVILLTLIAAYLGSLLILRQMSIPKSRDRLLLGGRNG